MIANPGCNGVGARPVLGGGVDAIMRLKSHVPNYRNCAEVEGEKC